MKKEYVLVFLRWIIGMVYLISGTEKLLQPYENFLYIIQEYDIIPTTVLEYIAAWVFPWLEFFLGGLLLLGLWTRESLISIGLFSIVFIIAVGQAIVRELPLAECGCFGDLIGMPLEATLMIDIMILLTVILLLYFYRRGTCFWAIDRCWQ